MATYIRRGSKGPAVKHYQERLKAKGYSPGPIDGQAGNRTCAAFAEAKFGYGYPMSQVKPFCGPKLMLLLDGKAVMTADQKRRHLARVEAEKKREAAVPMRVKAYKEAETELGTFERGGNTNKIKYNDWWGWGAVPYCVIGLSWCYLHITPPSTAFVRGSRWAGTDNMLADAKAGRNGLRITGDPKRGDCAVIDFDGHVDPDHGILVDRVDANWVWTIEFNTGGSSGREGVWREKRPRHHCWFIRVER
jgi:hypothetical protein